jgi:hypothetical protein
VTLNVVGPVSVATKALPEAAVGKVYSQALNGAGGTGGYTWSISSGALPPGLSLAPSTGVVSGTPTASGKASFTVHLADAGPPTQFATRTLELTTARSLAVESSALLGATTSTAYTQTLTAVGGTAPYRWSLAPGQGTLPEGLSLDPDTGTIKGAPGAIGTSDFTAQVTDSSVPSQSAVQHLALTVTKPLTISTLSLPDAVTDTAYFQPLGATGGTPPYTWSVWSGALPKGLTLNATSGAMDPGRSRSASPTRASRAAGPPSSTPWRR